MEFFNNLGPILSSSVIFKLFDVKLGSKLELKISIFSWGKHYHLTKHILSYYRQLTWNVL